MIDGINRFFAWVVSVNYYIYMMAGLLLSLALYFCGSLTSVDSHLSFLKNIGIPVIFFSLLLRLFCQIFYKEKYYEFQFHKTAHNRHIGIPRTDDIFYTLITEKDLKHIRKFSGYVYAVSKPMIFIVYGMVIVSLLIVINGRV